MSTGINGPSPVHHLSMYDMEVILSAKTMIQKAGDVMSHVRRIWSKVNFAITNDIPGRTCTSIEIRTKQTP